MRSGSGGAPFRRAPSRLTSPRRKRELAADDRLHAGVGAGRGEFEGAEQIAAVGDRHRRHLVLLAQADQLLDLDRAGRERIGGMDAQMDEIGDEP